MSKSIFISVLLSVILLLQIGCGQKNEDSEPAAKAPIGNIKVDAYVDQSQRDDLAEAIASIDSISTWNENGRLPSIMGVPQLSSQSIHEWLENRVHYIVAKNFDVTKQGYYAANNYNYQYPLDFPENPNGLSLFSPSQAQLLMLNLGAGVYIMGKKNRALVGLHISRVGEVMITSPRVGILQIGEGLFSTPALRHSPGSKFFLLSVLMHEARHSDGRGQSVGFTHAVCPAGHQYAGLAACDKNLNGPYSIEAEFLREVLLSCTDCSVSDKEILRINYLDSMSRVLKTTIVDGKKIASSAWDDQPEGQ